MKMKKTVTLTCLFLSSMILVICIFFRPMAVSFPASLTPQQYQKNNKLSSTALLAHRAKDSLLVLRSFTLLNTPFALRQDPTTISKMT